jgi:cell division protein FtsB
MKMVLLVLVLLLAVLQYKLWFANSGVRDVRHLKATIALQQKENEHLAKRNAILEEEVKELKQGKTAAQERARHDLGMIKKDETYYQFVH